MSKVDILRLDSVTSNDTTATNLINTNFSNIQAVIETLLSRTGATPNYMTNVLDMNSNRIINTVDPIDDLDVVNLRYLNSVIGDVLDQLTLTQNAAEAALERAQNAAASANSAATSAASADYAARTCQSILDQITGASSDFQLKSNLVTTISDASTNTQYPSAKCMYDIIGNLETILAAI